MHTINDYVSVFGLVTSMMLATTLESLVAQRPYEAFGIKVSDRRRWADGMLVRPVDINGDGIPDLVAGGPVGVARSYKNPAILLGDGFGGFEHVSWLTYPDLANAWAADPWAGVTDIEPGDYNGDGNVDLFFALGSAAFNQPPGYDRLFFGNGKGGFTDQQRDDLPRIRLATRDAHAVDVDGDGDLDLLLAGFESGATRLYLNDGKGRFLDVTGTQMPQGMTWLSHGARWDTGDLDGDGYVDAVLARGMDQWATNPASNLILLNDGKGRFRYAPSPFPALKTGGATLGDIDGDGDLDIVTANWTQTGVWINDGMGNFTDETVLRFPVDTGATSWVGFTDWDRDGDLDVILTGMWFARSVRMFENDGRGYFGRLPASSAVGGTECWNPYFTDLDGDADEDVVMGLATWTVFPPLDRHALAWVMWNTQHHMHVPYYQSGGMGPIEELEMGKSYNYELYSTFHPRVLFNFATLDPVDLQLPPFGRWRLDPGPMFFLGSGLARPSAPVVLQLALPRVPVLAGRDFYMQALSIQPTPVWIEGFSNATRHRLR